MNIAHTNLRRAIGRTALALTALTATFTTLAMEAKADAIGYAYWGIHVYKDIPIPAGQLTGGVWGNGLYVHDAGGNFLSGGNLCNWHVDIDFLDLNNKRYDYIRGTTVPTCNRRGTQKWLIKKQARPGKLCVRLYTAGSDKVASVCHNITR